MDYIFCPFIICAAGDNEFHGNEFKANDIIEMIYDGTQSQITNVPAAPLILDRTNNTAAIGSTTTNLAALRVVNANAGLPVGVFVSAVGSDSSLYGIHIQKTANDNTTAQRFVYFLINNGATASGQINANGANQGAFGTTSDVRLKENIVDIDSQLDDICALRPVEFDYKDGSGHQIGFIAQEVQTIYPDLVGTNSDGFLTLSDLSKNDALTIKAIQELNAKVEALEARVAETSSAWGVMEAAIRNLVGKKVLNCCCGAFSDKWFDVSIRCGLQAETLKVEWGQPILPDQIDAKLKTGQFDAITLVHNETSTGVMNPLPAIAEVMKRYPDVMFIVDSVSSMSGVPLKFDELGIDVLLAGTQKAFAMPPGTAVFVCSAGALAKAAGARDRGYYFDLIEFQQNAEQWMTPLP